MRDSLTVVAGALAVALAAALVAPPFVDWGAWRATIDAALARSLGVEAATEGRLELRLLPSPRLRADRLTLGRPEPDRAALDARFVKAEIALASLIRGELRFTEARVGRAEIRLPATPDGAPILPALAVPAASGLAVEDLRVMELALTATVPETGRTNQLAAQNVAFASPSLAGPWRIEGERDGAPFRLTTGAPEEGVVPVKLVAGGDAQPRVEVDARLTLDGDGAARVPTAAGTARLLVGPPVQAAGAVVPANLSGNFRARGRRVEFETLSVEVGAGGASLRGTGKGTLDLESGRASMTLDSRRLDLDSFLVSAVGQGLISRAGTSVTPSWSGWPSRLDLTLAAEAATLAQETWSSLALEAALTPSGRAHLRRGAAVAPGEARLAASGDVDGTGAFSGRVSAVAPASDRLGRTLARFGLSGPPLTLLDGRPLDAAADVALSPGQVSLSNARLALGPATLTGNARYLAPLGDGRGRFDAQLAGQSIDLAALPLQGAFDGLSRHDLGLTLVARDVRYGPSGPRGGRISASIQSDGPALVVDALDVSGLAGADAKLAGRIAPDGSGRIAGRVTAADAGPLVDLLGRAVPGARLLPPFLRAGAVDLELSAERDAAAAGRPLRTTAQGRAGGGRIEAALVLGQGRTESLDLTLSGDDAGRWLGRAGEPALRRPASLSLRGVRVPSGGLGFTLAGEIAGTTLRTTRPVALGEGEDTVEAGEVEVASPDLTPLLPPLLIDPVAGPVPAQLRIGIGRERTAPTLALSGSLAGAAVQANLLTPSPSEVTGRVSLDRLSLPWLAAALAVPSGDARAAASPWPTARFAPLRRPFDGGQVQVAAARLDLGRGLVAERGSFTLTVLPQGLSLKDLDAGLLGGRLTGTVAFNRQEGLASVAGEGAVRDVPLAALAGDGGLSGRLTASLRFGASGESPAGLVANLAGSGEFAVADLVAPGADPAAPERALARALAGDDPLRAGRLQALVAEELGRGPLRAVAPVAGSAALVGGTARIGPLTAEAGAARWQGSAQLDLRALRLDARGALVSAGSPKGWTGAPPAIVLGYAGPVARPSREVDVAPLTNGLAALVLQRELETIELYEADSAERARRGQRLQMDRARIAAERAAAEEAVRRTRLEAEAARQAEIARQAEARAEAARQARLRAEAEARRGSDDAPLDIRPPAARETAPQP